MTEKKVLIITICVIGVVIVLGGVAIWYMQFKVLAAQETTNKQRSAEIADLTAKNQELAKMKIRLPALREESKVFEEQVPYARGPGFDMLVNHLYSLEKKCGVNVSRVDLNQKTAEKAKKPAKGAAVGPSPLEPITTEYKLPKVSGPFYEVGKFLHALETEPLIVIVKEFTIKGGKVARGASKVPVAVGIPPKDMNIIVQSYMFEAPKVAVTKPVKPTPGPTKKTP